MNNAKLTHCLFSLRITVFLVLLMWTLNKFVRPEHAAAVYERFYFLGGIGKMAFSSSAQLSF